MPPSVDFIQQKPVGSQGKVIFPDKVADRLIPDRSSDELRARWNLNKEHKDAVISTDDLKEDYTGVRTVSKVDIEDERISIPEEILKFFDISVGDDVYFIGMADGEYQIPAVLFWTFERMEDMITGENKDTSYDYLRVPEFV